MTKKGLLILLIIIATLGAVLGLSSCNKALPQPANVTVNEDTNVLKWDKVEGADCYMLALNGDYSRQFMTEKTSFAWTDSSDFVNALLSGEQNTVQVRAANMAEDTTIPKNGSDWSESASFYFIKKVKNISIVKISTNKENVLEWKALSSKNTPEGAVYILAYRLKNTESWSQFDIITPTKNDNTGEYSFVYSEALSSAPAGKYELSVIVRAEGYELSDVVSIAEIDWEGGSTPPPPPPATVVLSSISATYTGGEVSLNGSLDTSKVTVTATYDNNQTKSVIGWTHNFTSATAGVKTVTITYVEGTVSKTATISVTVKAEEPPVTDDSCKIMGVDGDYINGIAMTLNANAIEADVEYMYLGLELDGTEAIKFVYDDEWYGQGCLQSGVASNATPTYDANGNMVFAQGKYNFYFKVLNQDTAPSYVIWVTKVTEQTGNLIYGFRWAENWIGNDNAVVLVWACNGGTLADAWYEALLLHDEENEQYTVTVTLPASYSTAVLVRFPEGTTADTADWDNKYDQTNDIDLTAGSSQLVTTKSN